jgi:hypothetical protein
MTAYGLDESQIISFDAAGRANRPLMFFREPFFREPFFRLAIPIDLGQNK